MSTATPKCNKKETIYSTELAIVRFNNGRRPMMVATLTVTRPL
jgi:hypothetical protein